MATSEGDKRSHTTKTTKETYQGKQAKQSVAKQFHLSLLTSISVPNSVRQYMCNFLSEQQRQQPQQPRQRTGTM